VARFEALHRGNPGVIGDATKKAVKDRYYRLAAANISHFAGGGTASRSYSDTHRDALRQAFLAGATEDRVTAAAASVSEAFSEHYLTDMFSAGHIRTPRIDIKRWYDVHIPNSVGRFIDYTARWITNKLDSYGDIPFWCPNDTIQEGIGPKIRELGGAAVDSFSLGDMVSLALHDRDNELGLWVKSAVDMGGRIVAGGFPWPERALGDNNLAQSPTGAAMAEASVRASLREFAAARAAGAAAAHGTCRPVDELHAASDEYTALLLEPAALAYVPTLDEARMRDSYIAGPDAAPTSGPIDYRWGTLDPTAYDAIDSTIKGTIAGQLTAMAASVAAPNGVIEAANIAEWLPGLGPDMAGHNFPLITLRVRNAFTEFCAHLRSVGISAIAAAVGRQARP
jgi:hypothetical protein